MGIEATTQSNNGDIVIPASNENWRDWVSATSIRNYLLDDTLVDWLDEYGAEKGFQRDSENPRYDPRTDFTRFIMRKSQEFETAVINHIRTLSAVSTIAMATQDARNLSKAQETYQAMERGEPVIYKAVLWNAENRTYGIPDLLVRSDELSRLFPGILTKEESAEPASAFPGVNWHYRVVDIKFTTIDLLAGGEVGNSGSYPAYKGQLYLYNHALGRIQGYLPPISYLLGRSWEQTVKAVTSRGKGCIERLGPVSQNSSLAKGKTLASEVEQALTWVRRLRQEGMDWSVLPEPTIPELRPNMGADQGGTWSSSKTRIAKELEELTLLWQVGVEKRRAANKLGIYRWSDPNCTAITLGVTGPKMQPVLQAILDINRSTDEIFFAPDRITVAEGEWRTKPALEFYVDFETVSDLDDDFSKIPERGGQPMIFMIGCGHIEDGKWRFECFTADALTEACEAEIVDVWLNHMSEVRTRLSPSAEEPMIIHWSQAETSSMTGAYNSTAKRHSVRQNDWPTLRWFDFLKQVIKESPVVVRGAWGFGLKAIAQGLYARGSIATHWDDGPTDGLGAMIGAWSCAQEAKEKQVHLSEIDLMQGIQSYNEVDCKAIMEIVSYLRDNH